MASSWRISSVMKRCEGSRARGTAPSEPYRERTRSKASTAASAELRGWSRAVTELNAPSASRAAASAGRGSQSRPNALSSGKRLPGAMA